MKKAAVDVFYSINSQFPSPRANTIQVMNTCAAMARLGATVRILMREEGSGSREEILEYYGVGPCENLILEPLRTTRRGGDLVFNASFQVAMIRRLMTLSRVAACRVLFTRDAMCASAVLRFRMLLRLPVLYEVHALNHWTNPLFTNTQADPARIRRLKKRERFVYEKAKGLVAISGSCRDALLATFQVPGSVAVVPDGTALRVPPEEKRVTGQPRLLYIGQFYPWKGVETAVRAMRELPGLSLDLYGGDYFTAAGDIARLQHIAAECGSSGAVSFKGYVPPAKLVEVLREDYIGVLPPGDNVMGRHFISPLKLFEYMGCCIPVVASDLPPIREIVTHERNGLLFRPDDPTDLAAQVRRLIDDPALREVLIRRAFEDSREYSYERRARAILGVISAIT